MDNNYYDITLQWKKGRSGMVIKNEAQREKAIKVLEKSEAACLISNSVKSRIIFNPEIIVNKI